MVGVGVRKAQIKLFCQQLIIIFFCRGKQVILEQNIAEIEKHQRKAKTSWAYCLS